MRAEPFFCHRAPQSGSDKAFGSHDPVDRSALLKGFPVHGPAVLASNRINQRPDTASLPALSANPDLSQKEVVFQQSTRMPQCLPVAFNPFLSSVCICQRQLKPKLRQPENKFSFGNPFCLMIPAIAQSYCKYILSCL